MLIAKLSLLESYTARYLGNSLAGDGGVGEWEEEEVERRNGQEREGGKGGVREETGGGTEETGG